MSLTPAMEQFYTLKEENKDAILFFRMGDFYEMFDDDAVIAHKILWINLTSRNKNAEKPIPLAGIPYHAKEKYLYKLIDAWYKVAIAEQVSDPMLKWIVQREVVRVVTPGTLALEEEWYETKDQSNYICSIVQIGDLYGFSVINVTKQSWICSEFKSLEDLSTEIYKISPSEVILEKSLIGNSKLEETLLKKFNLNIYYYTTSINYYDFLTQKLQLSNLDAIGIENKKWAQKASAYILHYIEGNQKTSFDFLDSLTYENFSWFLELDEATIKSLDLVYNISTSSKTQGTLLWVLSHAGTPMGKRYLREQILRPLQDIKEIKNRQKFIKILKDNPILLSKIQTKLKSIWDIDAILTRISLERAGPKDLLLLKNSLIEIRDISDILQASDIKKLSELFSKS